MRVGRCASQGRHARGAEERCAALSRLPRRVVAFVCLGEVEAMFPCALFCFGRLIITLGRGGGKLWGVMRDVEGTVGESG